MDARYLQHRSIIGCRAVLRARTAVLAVALAIGLVGTTSTPALAGREARALYVGTKDSVVRYVAPYGASYGGTTTGCSYFASVESAGGGSRDQVGAGACFWLRPSESQVRVRIIDSSGLPVGATLWFGGRDGLSGDHWMDIGHRPFKVFCGRAVVAVPYGATYMIVDPGGHSVGQVDSGTSAPYPVLPCGPGTAGTATTGTIVAFFS